MKCMLSLAVLAALCGLMSACCFGSDDHYSGYNSHGGEHNSGYGGRQGYRYGHQPGFNVRPGAVEAVYNNAKRQLGVNGIARAYGTGIGTAAWYGVPGTGNYFDGHHGGYRANSYH